MSGIPLIAQGSTVPSADLLWVLTAAVLVFLMQAGFLALEAGLTRTKNNVNVAIKNLADFGVATFMFWLFGFAIMFGGTFGGWFGTSGFARSFDEAEAWPAVFFIFQLMFCATAVTIVSGAVAERLRFGAYLGMAALVAGVTYPIFGHWAWAGIDVGESIGWLAELGFIDFAGSTVVHSVGGWTGLAILVVIGARIGRFPKDGPPRSIQGSNLPLATLGVILLWVGWLGFNGGSTLGVSADLGRVIANTVLAGTTGLLAAMLLGYRLSGRPEIGYVINGTLGGLVAITANAFAVTPISAAVIGAIGGLVAVFAAILLERLRIDDAVGAVPVHLAAGIWGTQAVGIFGDHELLGTGLSRIEQVGVQALGIAACAALVFPTTYLIAHAANRIRPLRVPPEAEHIGLNVYEHGATSELYDFVQVIDTQARTGDLSLRAQVEPFTEVGQIATGYNTLIDSLEETEAQVRDYQDHLEEIVDSQTEALRSTNAKLGLALEQLESTETIIERWTVDGVVLEMNQFGIDLFGFAAEEVIGRPGSETFRPWSDAWEAARRQLIANPHESLVCELECRKLDGTPVWVAWRDRPIVDENNNVTEVISIGFDITERREMEMQLAKAKDRMESELNIGRDIQMSMLPLDFPERPEFSIYATLEPAREVGGDFYDFFFIDEHHLCFCVGDVSDKGVAAALFMAVTKTLIKSYASSDTSPASILTAVNVDLNVNNDTSMFVTIFLCIIDLRSGRVVYTNAGHNPPYIVEGGGELITLDERHGPVTGAIEGIAYREGSRQLSAGDCMILFTDGVTEAMDPAEQLYSEERLESLLKRSRMVDTEEAVELVFDAVAEHRSTAEQSDDITVLAFSLKGTEAVQSHRIALAMNNNIDEIESVAAEFEAFAELHGLEEAVRRSVLLALDELLNNIVSYAYESDGDHQIEVDVELAPHRLVMTFSDDGVPFNPFGMERPDIHASIEERRIGGLGIHLVRTIMDEFDYSRRAGRNVVTVMKDLTADGSEGADV